MQLEHKQVSNDASSHYKNYICELEKIICELLEVHVNICIYANIHDTMEGNEIFFFELVMDKFKIKISDMEISNIHTFFDLYNIIYCKKNFS